MAFVKVIKKDNDTNKVEVFIKGKELLKVLQQQGIHASTTDPDESYCLTFESSRTEEYDY